jgi:anti-sigma regulatory factor (Ser/Thr protein kinase)
MAALRARRNLWIGDNGTTGFMRLGEDFGDNEETRWASFGLKSDKAMQAAGLPAGLAGQLVGATKELHSNVYEHSEKSRSGIVAFAVHKDMAEFIVADSGIGVLASLRTNPVHESLQHDGEALHLALQPGVTRYASDPTRGHGFDLMFTGLLNHGSKLRFRSGTAAVTIDGLAKGNPVPIIRDRPAMQGFLIGVDCRARGQSGLPLTVPV